MSYVVGVQRVHPNAGLDAEMGAAYLAHSQRAQNGLFEEYTNIPESA